MGRIQSSVGLVTGVAIEDTVNQLMQLNAIPRDRLVSRNAQLGREQVALTELTAIVVGVQLSTDRLGQASLFSATNVASSDSSSLKATSTGTPVTGSYSFVPVKKAQSQQLTSSFISSADQTLSAGEIVLHQGGFLDESVDLDSLNGGQGVARGRLRITDRSGTSQTIDLRYAQTANDVVEAINSNDSLGVVASLKGSSFELTDISGGTGTLQVDEVSGGTTASDLGLGSISANSDTALGSSVYQLSSNTALNKLLDGRGITLPTEGAALQFSLADGSTVDFSTELDPSSASLGQLVDEINTAGAGSLEARINSTGTGLEVEDLTAGGGTFEITSPNGSLAEQLGFTSAASGGVIEGNRLLAGLGDTLLSSFRGGEGFGDLGQITITDRSGTADTIDLSSAETLEDVLDALNGSAAGIEARLNSSKTGIEVLDTTGATSSDLRIEDADATNSATALGIAGTAESDRVSGGSLGKQAITRSTLLSDYGSGVPLGSFRLTDSAGNASALNLSTLEAKTVGDVVDAINGLGIGVEARFNETGDGLLLVDTAGGTESLLVEDVGTGTTAQKLGIAGTGQTLTVGGSEVVGIDGSQTIRIETTAETTVSELADLINGLEDGPLTASLLTLNSEGGVRLLLNGTSTGADSRVTLDSNVGVSFTQTTEASDALLAFGGNDADGGVLVSSSTNDFEGLVDGVTFTVEAESDSPVTINVSENTDGITRQIDAFVNQYNRLQEKIAELTAFDADTNSVGLLFGSTATLRTESAYTRLLSGVFRGVGSISSLGEVGIRLNDTGQLEFDQSKFEAALSNDRAAVEKFFTDETSGFSAKAKQVADRLAGVENGALLNRSNALQTQIEQNESRITSFNGRLDRQRTRLLTQFFNMEETIARLQQNLTALNQLQPIPPLSASSG